MLRLRTLFSQLPALTEQIVGQPIRPFHVSAVDLKARKGTRAKWDAEKKKFKAARAAREAAQNKNKEKEGYVPRNRKVAGDLHLLNYDGDKEISADDVFSIEHYQRPTFTFVDAIEAHKEAHHPTMLDAMHEPLNISIEMDMRGEREIKNVSDFRQLVKLAHPFDHGQQRKILFFAREEKNRVAAVNAGATEVGGHELIKTLLKGKMRTDGYDYILAHSDIITELLSLRGVLGKRFPSIKAKTLGNDAEDLVRSYTDGLLIEGMKDGKQKTFGCVNACVGTLTMETDELAENCRSIVTTINERRPDRGGRFITRVFLKTAMSSELLRINPNDFPFDDYERPIAETNLNQPKRKKKANPNTIPRVYELFRTPTYRWD